MGAEKGSKYRAKYRVKIRKQNASNGTTRAELSAQQKDGTHMGPWVCKRLKNNRRRGNPFFGSMAVKHWGAKATK